MALVRFTEGFTLQVGHFNKWIFIFLIVYHNLKLILGDQHFDTLSRNCCAGKNNWIDLLIEIKSNPLSAGPRVLPHVANGSYRPSSADSSESGYSGILKESIKVFLLKVSRHWLCNLSTKHSWNLWTKVRPRKVIIYLKYKYLSWFCFNFLYRKNLQLQLSNNRQSASFFCK